jgi:curved DNA-binding protein CbpA
MKGDDPFSALGLPPRPDLTDDEVRAAWRRIAAATHPDLPDGGDGARFAAAAAAYAELRTPYGRGEAYADLETGSEAYADLEAGPEAYADLEASPEADANLHTGPETSANLHTDADLHANLQAGADPQAGRSAAVPPLAPAADHAAATRRAPAHNVARTADSRLAGARLAGLRLAARVQMGRPGVLALRLLLAIAVSGASVAIAGWQPATLSIAVGALTWLARTTRHDLAPPPPPAAAQPAAN